jgi:hypothetical protein
MHRPAGLVAEPAVVANKSTLGDLVVLELPLQPIELDFRAPSVRLDEHAEVAGVLLVRHEHGHVIDALEIIHAVGLSDIVWPAEYIQNGRVQLGKIGLGRAAADPTSRNTSAEAIVNRMRCTSYLLSSSPTSFDDAKRERRLQSVRGGGATNLLRFKNGRSSRCHERKART